MKIFCPVDFSKAANNAVEYAARFARETNSEIQLAHVSLAPTVGELLLSGFDESKNTFQASFEKLQDYCKEVENSFQVTCSAIIQNQDESLEEDLGNYIDANVFDLVIMGTNSAEYANQLYFGTHTYKLIRKSNTPILILPEDCEFTPLRHVVFATDFQHFSETSINEMLELIAPFQPGMDILNVSEVLDSNPPEKEVEAVKKLVKNKWKIEEISFRSVVGKTPAEGIDEFMRRQKRDLLVLTTRKYSLIESLFKESVTKKLSYIAEYPILVLSRE